MPKVVKIGLQPKQGRLLEMLKDEDAPCIGIGGGRGAAKSSGADRVAITLLTEQPGTLACMMMRNWDQIFKYHIEPISRDFEWLAKSIKRTMPASLKIGKSQLDFSYAENLDDIERRFRSANYKYIFIDQAEQFSEKEIREIRKANRVKGGGKAKIVLLFNMRGAGIAGLRKWFYLHDVNKDEDPNDYAFLKVNPWDNIEWVRVPLEEDGYTEYDYYHWTDEQRKAYAAERGPYTKGLATDDEVIRKADWEGDWDSLEGVYFSNSFDQEATRITADMAEHLNKPWASHWLAQDWGKTHNCATYWAMRIHLSPSEAKTQLGWDVPDGINVTTIYREMIVNEMDPAQVARSIIDSTPEPERKQHKAFFLSPEEATDDPNCVGSQQSKVLRLAGMPGAIKADNERIGGWMLIDKMLRATKGRGWGVDKEGNRFQYTDALLISVECQELLAAIPILMRDPKNLDDVLKTDKGSARIEQDVSDACFVAETQIWTKRGDVAIEKVVPGDEVMTRKGWRKVAHSWMTRKDALVVRAIFSDGSVVVCTPNHLFATDKGFVQLDSLRYSDKLITWKQLSLTEEYTPSEKMGTTQTDSSSFTERCGSFTKGRFLKGTLSTTSTILQRALQTYRNLHVLLQKSTQESMRPTDQTRRSTLRKYVHSLLGGIGLQRDASGTVSTPQALFAQNMRGSARSAGSSLLEIVEESSVPTTANRHGVESSNSISSQTNARFAEKNLAITDTTKPSIAAENAPQLVGLQQAGFADVYDLEVEEEHEFFANGMLVHNCRYLLKSMLAPKKRTEEDRYQEQMAQADPAVRLMLTFRHQIKAKSKKPVLRKMPPSWRGNLG